MDSMTSYRCEELCLCGKIKSQVTEGCVSCYQGSACVIILGTSWCLVSLLWIQGFEHNSLSG